MVRPHPKVIRVLLLIVIPVMAVLVGGVLWLRGGGSVGTEDAYVKNDIAQIAPEIAGRVAEVMVRDHAQIGAGDVLVKLDAEPFRLVLAKAEAELDAARTTVGTARAQWLETRSELGEVESQADYLNRQATRQQALAEHRAGRFAEAQRLYRQVLEIRPDDAEAWNGLAMAIDETGDSEGAMECWRKAIALRPDFAEAHNHLGLVLDRVGESSAAFSTSRALSSIRLH